MRVSFLMRVAAETATHMIHRMPACSQNENSHSVNCVPQSEQNRAISQPISRNKWKHLYGFRRLLFEEFGSHSQNIIKYRSIAVRIQKLAQHAREPISG